MTRTSAPPKMLKCGHSLTQYMQVQYYCGLCTGVHVSAYCGQCGEIPAQVDTVIKVKLTHAASMELARLRKNENRAYKRRIGNSGISHAR